MTPLSNENAKLYKVYALVRLYIMTKSHMAFKWGSRPPQNSSNLQFLPVISIGK